MADDHPSRATPPSQYSLFEILRDSNQLFSGIPQVLGTVRPRGRDRKKGSSHQDLTLQVSSQYHIPFDVTRSVLHMAAPKTDSRCKTINTLWVCDTLEKAQGLLQDIRTTKEGHVTLENFISNTFVPHESDNWVDSYEPKTGKILARVPISSTGDVRTAVNAATAAFSTWSKTSRVERSRYMQRIAALIQQNRELFAVWESIDQGKTLERSRIEVDRAISNFS